MKINMNRVLANHSVYAHVHTCQHWISETKSFDCQKYPLMDNTEYEQTRLDKDSGIKTCMYNYEDMSILMISLLTLSTYGVRKGDLKNTSFFIPKVMEIVLLYKKVYY